MTYQGQIKNGVPILDSPVSLSDGTPVRVEVERTDVDEYRLQKRGGSGVINIKTTDRNGPVVALRAVRDDDELMLITAAGIMLRTAVAELREIGRATQGVRVIRLDQGDKVVAVARVAKEEDEDEPAAAAPEPPAEPTDSVDDAASTDSDDAPEPDSSSD